MPAEAGSVWRCPTPGFPDEDEIVVLSLGYAPPNGPKDFTVCLTLYNGQNVFDDTEVGELDNWPLGIADAWTRAT